MPEGVESRRREMLLKSLLLSVLMLFVVSTAQAHELWCQNDSGGNILIVATPEDGGWALLWQTGERYKVANVRAHYQYAGLTLYVEDANTGGYSHLFFVSQYQNKSVSIWHYPDNDNSYRCSLFMLRRGR